MVHQIGGSRSVSTIAGAKGGVLLVRAGEARLLDRAEVRLYGCDRSGVRAGPMGGRGGGGAEPEVSARVRG